LLVRSRLSNQFPYSAVLYLMCMVASVASSTYSSSFLQCSVGRRHILRRWCTVLWEPRARQDTLARKDLEWYSHAHY